MLVLSGFGKLPNTWWGCSSFPRLFDALADEQFKTLGLGRQTIFIFSNVKVWADAQEMSPGFI
jgi:hypothetical protein